MELTTELINLVKYAIIDPNVYSAFGIFAAFFMGELVFAFLPLTIILTSPLILYDGSITAVFLMKILIFVAGPVALATVLGSLPVFALAYWGGKPAVEKFGKHLSFSWKDVEKAEKKLQSGRYDEVIFLALRSAPFLPTLPVNIASGLLRMNLVPYFVLTLTGSVIRTMLMVLLISFGIIWS